MPTSFQTVRSKRERDRDRSSAGVASRPPLSEKPEDVRFGIVFLYASCAVALVFLIVAGDVQWGAAVANNLTGTQATLVEMGATGLAMGCCGFLLSRAWVWPLYAVCAVTVVEVGFLAAFGGQIFTFSQPLFVSRLLSLLMDAAALVYFFRRPARGWFALLRERKAEQSGPEDRSSHGDDGLASGHK